MHAQDDELNRIAFLMMGTALCFFGGAVLGMLIGYVVGVRSELVVGCFACSSGLLTSAAAICSYRRSSDRTRSVIYQVLKSGFYITFGIWISGIVGSLIGGALGGERGEFLGWLTALLLYAIAYLTWQVLKRRRSLSEPDESKK